MNRINILIVLLVAVVLVLPASLSAAEGDSHKRHHPRAERAKNITPEERQERREKFKENHPEAAARIKEKREELKDLSPEERKERLKEMREERLEKISERWEESSDEDKAKFCRHAKIRCAEKEHPHGWRRCAFARKNCSGIADSGGDDAEEVEEGSEDEGTEAAE